MEAYQEYEKRITRRAFRKIPTGTYTYMDYMEDDGLGTVDIPIHVNITVGKQGVTVDFRKSGLQVTGPVNATYAITLSAVAYVFRCVVLALTGEDCLSLEILRVKTQAGTITHSVYPAPVAGGNVETSQRIVDVLFGALAKALPEIIPAASQGTMNNMALGSKDFTYYETMAGGMGASPRHSGESAIHTHMTNTLNTPIEALENELPFQVTAYQIRRGSGGRGKTSGGDGLIREFRFLSNAQLSLLTERRRLQPYGLKGGRPGKPGRNTLIRGNQKNETPFQGRA